MDTRFVLDSTELRLINFEMVATPRIAPALNVVRRSSRSREQRAAVEAERTIYKLSRQTHRATVILCIDLPFVFISIFFHM